MRTDKVEVWPVELFCWVEVEANRVACWLDSVTCWLDSVRVCWLGHDTDRLVSRFTAGNASCWLEVETDKLVCWLDSASSLVVEVETDCVTCLVEVEADRTVDADGVPHLWTFQQEVLW